MKSQDQSRSNDADGADYASTVTPNKVNPTLVTVLSILWPGLGQLVNGQVGKGLGVMALGIVLYIVAWPLALVLCAWAAYDAYQNANKINSVTEQQEEVLTKRAASEISAADFVSQIEKLNKLAVAGVLNADELADRKMMVIKILATKKPKESAGDFLTALIPLVQSGGLSQEELQQIKSLQV